MAVVKPRRRVSLVLIFSTFLILSAILAAAWFWATGRTGASPLDVSQERQEAFIRPERPSLLASLLNQKAIIISLALAALMLGAAAALAIAPFVWRARPKNIIRRRSSVQELPTTSEEQIVAQLLADEAFQEEEFDQAPPPGSAVADLLPGPDEPASVRTVELALSPLDEQNHLVTVQETNLQQVDVERQERDGQPSLTVEDVNDGRHADKLMQVFTAADDVAMEAATDSQETGESQETVSGIFDSDDDDGSQGILANILDVEDPMDPRLRALIEALGDELVPINIDHLAQRCRDIVDQLQLPGRRLG